ncbi:MATE family efflux transporter [Aliigemmobacter aestuarii]|uniref:MATE family efflux transporter n=1 Tax=Aliigemmobacter aestuarii TaxID=1445661 RepID=A0A4V3V0R5_9RHOB|nr:MATE family efflux transporter [Gemmobacter aestuarii]THD84912.1 MATE family efflux transporter [Gemmobacter aestuarii]
MADPAPSAEITHTRVLKIALPIVLSNATVPLLGAVDTGVVGQMGQAAPIGAVGVGAMILAMLYWVFGFLRMGTTGLVAQAHGQGDRAESSAVLLRAFLIAGAAGLMLIALQWPLFWAAFRLAPASAEVEGLAQSYLSLRIWGAPATIALYAVTGWLIAVERTRGVLVLQLWMNGLNVVLDLWFVLGLGWGVAGVATATLIAEWTGLLLGLWLCREALAGPMLAAARVRLADRAALMRMGAVNSQIMLRSILLQGAFATFLFMGAGQGDVTLAANQVLLQFLEITAYALDGFAFAAETLVGQAVGMRSAARLRRAAVISSIWGAGGSIALALAFLLAGPWIIDLMATAPDVRTEARAYLPWVVIGPMIGVASWMLDGIFIGATRTGDMLRAMVVSVAVYLLALAVLVPAYGNHGLWGALMVLNTARAITLARAYPRIEAATALG